MSDRAVWGRTVGTAIALQWAVIAGGSAVAWLLADGNVALSMFGGGVAVAGPNSLLALWLTLRLRSRGAIGAVAMMTGELVKLGLTIATVVVVVRLLQPGLSWFAMLLGLMLAVKAQWLALWVTRNQAPGKNEPGLHSGK